MQSLLGLAIVFVAIFVFLKFAGLCKNFSMSAGFKKATYLVSVVALVVLNIYASNVALELWVVLAGLVMVLWFTMALMSETKQAA